MCSNFIFGLLLVLVIIYLTNFIGNNEGFRVFNSNSNIYESLGVMPSKILYLTPPNSTQPNVDYQDYLNEVSGYDSGTRGYSNPIYAADVAAGLDTN
jgi:hypothetical protein